MTLNAFSLDEAREICEDFEDLIDTEFNVDSPFVFLIHDVMPCPYKEQDKLAFVENYVRTKDKDESIAFYKGDEFDVILFAFDETDSANYTYVNIRAYVDNNGVRYNFPRSED